MEYITYDVAFVFGVIFWPHCWWIFLILNSDWSWLIKFWSLKIKAQKQNPPKKSGHPGQRYWGEENFIHPLTPFNKNITGNLARCVDRFSLIHIFWHFDKCPSDHFKKFVMKFQKSKIWDVHFFSFSMLIIVAYAFWPYLSLSGGKWAPKMGRFWFLKKNQKPLKMFCKNPSLLKMIFIFLAA